MMRMSNRTGIVKLDGLAGRAAQRLGTVGDRYWIMLILLFTVILAAPFLSGLGFNFLLLFALISTVSSLVSGDRNLHLILRALSTPLLLFFVLAFIAPTKTVRLMETVPRLEVFLWTLGILLILGCGLLILIALLHVREITPADIAGVASLYLLIGFLWAHFYSILEYSVPGSFSMPDTADPFAGAWTERDYNDKRLLYYSFITLLTVGYGDIIPQNSLASSLAVLEAVVGQLFIVIVVATILSKRRKHSFA